MAIASSKDPSHFSLTVNQLETLGTQILEEAKRLGGTACEVGISESQGQNISVRLGNVETIEYNHDKALGITVYVGQRKGTASTSDFLPNSIQQTVAAAFSIARHTAEDTYAGLADPHRLATQFPNLDLYHPWALLVDDAIVMAQQCEAAALAVDKRIRNSEGATVSTHTKQTLYTNSHGFIGHNLDTRHSIVCSVIAQVESDMQRDYWYTNARANNDLEPAQAVGKQSGERALARLGAQRIKTGDYPVLFSAQQASGLLGHFVHAVSGSSLYRKASFLQGSLGKPVFSPLVNILEDPFLPRGFASSAFDAEGVATQRRQLVEKGTLNGYFLSSYSARKLGMESTGNAGGQHNLVVTPTDGNLPAMLQCLGTGLYVTELMGQGVNGITGDYSRGAAGFWVENGVIIHPVQEITIAGNLKNMYQQIVAIGADIETRGSCRVGSLLIEKMTVAGT